MSLDDFIAEHMRRPWEPGRTDCLLAIADWAVSRGYPDPAVDLRGTYDSEAGFEAIIAAAGGVVPLVQRCADFLGVKRVQTAKPGDAAVIGSMTAIQRQFGAIWDGRGWRVRFVNDYPAVSAHPLAIWSL